MGIWIPSELGLDGAKPTTRGYEAASRGVAQMQWKPR